MNQNIFVKIIIGAVVVLLAIAGLIFFTSRPSEAPIFPVEEDLTKELVLSILENELPGGCVSEGVEEEYRSCEIVFVGEGVSDEGEQWISVQITFDGFYDDSVRASRIDVNFVYSTDQWTISEISEKYKCHLGRGHQDFSEDICI